MRKIKTHRHRPFSWTRADGARVVPVRRARGHRDREVSGTTADGARVVRKRDPSDGLGGPGPRDLWDGDPRCPRLPRSCRGGRKTAESAPRTHRHQPVPITVRRPQAPRNATGRSLSRRPTVPAPYTTLQREHTEGVPASSRRDPFCGLGGPLPRDL